MFYLIEMAFLLQLITDTSDVLKQHKLQLQKLLEEVSVCTFKTHKTRMAKTQLIDIVDGKNENTVPQT